MSLKAILHYEHLMELYEEGSNSVETPLTDRFYQNPETVDGDDAKLFVDPIENSPAKLNRRSAPARMMELKDAREQRGALFHAFNQKRLTADLLMGLREPDSHMVDRMGAREARRQAATFGRQHAILKELAIAKILTNGVVYADVSGNILEAAGADDETYTFGIDPGHQAQLNYNGGGDLIADLWSDAAADIQAQVIAIEDAARAQNAAAPTLAITNSTTKNLFRNNTDFQTWAAASFRTSEQLLSGDMVSGLWGLDWLFIDGTYEDSTGASRKYIPDGKVVFLPADVSRWLRPVQGQEWVPTTLELQTSVESALGSVQEVAGRFSYAKVEHNPLSLNMYMGDNFGWVIANDKAIWQATVV